MALTDKIKNFSNNVQQTTKNATYSLGHILLRIISGFLIGLVLALICQELFSLGLFMLVFLNVLFLALIYKLLAPRTIFQIVVFDFICVLIASLLRMYIQIAPN
jgi:small-conductance mechanosensitive channel